MNSSETGLSKHILVCLFWPRFRCFDKGRNCDILRSTILEKSADIQNTRPLLISSLLGQCVGLKGTNAIQKQKDR